MPRVGVLGERQRAGIARLARAGTRLPSVVRGGRRGGRGRGEGGDRGAQGGVGRQHAEVAVAVNAWWRDESGEAVAAVKMIPPVVAASNTPSVNPSEAGAGRTHVTLPVGRRNDEPLQVNDARLGIRAAQPEAAIPAAGGRGLHEKDQHRTLLHHEAIAGVELDPGPGNRPRGACAEQSFGEHGDSRCVWLA